MGLGNAPENNRKQPSRGVDGKVGVIGPSRPTHAGVLEDYHWEHKVDTTAARFDRFKVSICLKDSPMEVRAVAKQVVVIAERSNAGGITDHIRDRIVPAMKMESERKPKSWCYLGQSHLSMIESLLPYNLKKRGDLVQLPGVVDGFAKLIAEDRERTNGALCTLVVSRLSKVAKTLATGGRSGSAHSLIDSCADEVRLQYANATKGLPPIQIPMKEILAAHFHSANNFDSIVGDADQFIRAAISLAARAQGQMLMEALEKRQNVFFRAERMFLGGLVQTQFADETRAAIQEECISGAHLWVALRQDWDRFKTPYLKRFVA